jgi:hypothetical protein
VRGEGPVWRDPLIYFPPLLWALNVVAWRAAMREIPPEWGSFLRFALALPFFLLWTYAASTCTGNRGLKSRLSLPAMSLRRHW